MKDVARSSANMRNVFIQSTSCRKGAALCGRRPSSCGDPRSADWEAGDASLLDLLWLFMLAAPEEYPPCFQAGTLNSLLSSTPFQAKEWMKESMGLPPMSCLGCHSATGLPLYRSCP